ncbi:MAG: PVC-type heme-binding CxxCH protein, partial [Verrucomicrobiota bacterium]
ARVAEWRQEDPGTIPAGDVYGTGSPTGIAFYESGALGKKYPGLLLSCEAARNVVFGYFPKPSGAGFELERFDFLRAKRADEFAEDGEKMAGEATWFRPSDVTVGPDGAIYVADWFDARVGGHRMVDTHAAGTIYRIAPKGVQLTIPPLDLETLEGQIAALKSPANNVRNIGFTRLKAASERSLPAVEALLDDANPYFQARAVWLLAQMGERGLEAVESILKTHADPQMRIVAFRALRFVEHKTLEHATRLSRDPSPAVRREVALALRDLPLSQCQEILLNLAKRYDSEDRWYLEALGTACAGKEEEIYPVLLRELGNADSTKWSDRFAEIAWRLHPRQSTSAFRKRAMASSLPLNARKDALTALAYIPTKGAAVAMVHVAEQGADDLRPLAQWWLYNRSSHLWSDFAGDMRGLNVKPDQLKPDQDYKAPIDGPEPVKIELQDVLALNGDPVRGKATVARCYMCHQVDGNGVEFGPTLEGWGKGNSREVIATALIDPNKDIAHGFEGMEIETKDGHIIQGFVLFSGGTHILKVFGGGEVEIPRKLIKETRPMKRSLMMSAGQLGLTAQDIADLVAYLKSDSPAT